MKIEETLKYALITLDNEKDFSKQSISEIFEKIKKYKGLPFHDVIVQMDSKYFAKFWEPLSKLKITLQDLELKNNLFKVKL